MLSASEIALELTKAAIEKGLIRLPAVKDDESNKASAENIARAFDIIYKSVDETLALK